MRVFRRPLLVVLASLSLFFFPSRGDAYINQADGTVVPVSDRVQQCLDASEGVAGALDAVADATVLPEAYRPVFDAVSGRYRVTFTDIAEGAGFRNSFGWFWVGEDVTNPANLRTIFGCRTYGTCACPCTTSRTIVVDFDTQPGFSVGRQIGFWLRTPERLDGSRESAAFPSGCPMALGCDPAGTNVDDSCGGRRDTNNRIYFTSAALNDDGDFVHFLVHRSARLTNTYYFGFEDLYRGGDNDYEDMLVRGTGLVPLCDPRPETCNNADDDCDSLVDEGITRACSTACGAGVETCRTGSFGTCSARRPTTEVCNNINDDCDAATDEGLSRACSNTCGSGTEICVAGTFADCTAPTARLETCNNTDEDCDGRIDEGLMRACSSACGSGTETCSAGTYGRCTAATPGTEICNADDDDCDGRVDEGLVRDCANSCGPGIETCRAGTFGGCTAPAPRVEACNNLDEDCDGRIDEGLTRSCASACGTGTEMCVSGAFVGCTAPGPGTETCNNIDDDCDGVIDDGNPGGGDRCVPLPGGGYRPPSADDGDICRGGTVRCVGGALVCQGAASGGSEVCNCLDDDCDGMVDEDSAADPLCPGGACIATECACASPCDLGEFPCPPGRICDTTTGEPGLCLAGRCAGVVCDMESVCDIDTGECRNLCSSIMCPSDFACVRGACVEDNCYGRGCPTGEVCRTDSAGAIACVADACASVVCGESEFCRAGTCIAACNVECESGQVCRSGECVDQPCDGGCASGSSCIDDVCTPDNCGVGCGRGRVCRGNLCVDDPCVGIRCPGSLVCNAGECTDPTITPRPRTTRGLASGGALCAAQPGQGQSGQGAVWLTLLIALGLVVRRARPSKRLIQRAALGMGVASALMLSGCAVDPFCFSGCDDEEVDAGIVDANLPRDTNVGPTDGCVFSGDETCDSVDNDCDGRIDETFNLESNPRNCGGCGVVCMLPHAFPTCEDSACGVLRCEIGWVDLNGTPADGCEYSCPPDGDELCDGRDNDCDGAMDEGFDLRMDLANCGTCGNQCAFSNASATCADSACVLSTCLDGYVDSNGNPADGCEYRCSNTGVERCDGVDDDCDRMIDEGFDTTTDAMNCGVCGRVCTFPNAVPRCSAGACTFGVGDCLPGFFDLDRDVRNGCEYACVPTGAADTCNRVDDDCDGAVDEAEPMVGMACGTATGACEPGRFSCVRGAIQCGGSVGPQSELCNAADDDCDGRTDESVAGAPIPGVGDRCGATDLGICAYGTLSCTGGALSCSGATTSRAELCNGLDDDCDGALDDGLTRPASSTIATCAETRGVCAGRLATCRGVAGWACDFPTTYQAVETRCDTLDNDCDGTADEGCLRPTGTDVRIDTQNAVSLTNTLDPVIVASGANVQAAWTETFTRNVTNMDGTITTFLDARAHGNRSADNGGTWATGTRLNTTNGDTFSPQVVIGASNVLWAWADFRGGTGYREAWTRRSTDAAGATLAAEVRANPGSVNDSYGVRIARAGTVIYATYEAFTSSRNRHIFFTRSTDAGATWLAPIQASTSAAVNFVGAQPRIAAAGTRAYVIWRDNRSGSLDVFTRVWDQSAGAFVAAERRMDVGTTAGSSSSFSASIAAEGNNVYAVWVDDRDRGSFDIWMNRSTDAGATWLAGAVKLDGDTIDNDSIEPQVVAPDVGDVMVAWIDYRSGFPDPFVTRSANAGMTFSAPERVDTGTSPGASGSYEIALAASGNLAAIVWADDRAGLLDIYANFTLDQGLTWQPQDYRLDSSTLGTSDSQNPVVAISGSRVHVAWVDHRRGASCPSAASGPTCPEGDLYYRRIE